MTHFGGLLRGVGVLLALVAPLALSCAHTAEGEPAPAEVAFVDSKIFDDQLKASLTAGHEQVEVVFRGTDATVNNLPERISVWLETVTKREGARVVVLPDPDQPQGRGIESIALALVMGAYSLVHDATYYWPARSYDATVYYLDGPGTLTRIVFKRAPERS